MLFISSAFSCLSFLFLSSFLFFSLYFVVVLFLLALFSKSLSFFFNPRISPNQYFRGQPSYIIIEFMSRGDLKKFLHLCRPPDDAPSAPGLLNPASQAWIGHQVADGVAYLASCQYVHRFVSCFVVCLFFVSNLFA